MNDYQNELKLSFENPPGMTLLHGYMQKLKTSMEKQKIVPNFVMGPGVDGKAEKMRQILHMHSKKD